MDYDFGDQYLILWQARTPGPVAHVRNYEATGKRYRQIPVFLDDVWIQQARMRLLVVAYVDDNPCIIVSQAFMDLPRDLRDAGIWHEVGHVHFEHMLTTDCLDQDALRAARLLAIRSDRVWDKETEADGFAVRQVGKDAVVAFLSFVLRTRPIGGSLNDAGSRELELRIATVRALDD